MSKKINFSKFDGKGIKVAIIDSGVDLENAELKKRIKKGINLTSVSNSADVQDEIGHGTACASIILKKAPSAELYIAKVFSDELRVSTKTIIKALEWCLKNDVDVINMSLASNRNDCVGELRKICEKNSQRNTIIVAVEGESGLKYYPAHFKNVIGVSFGEIKGKYNYCYHENKLAEVSANSTLQRLTWLDNKNVLMKGTSFACAHISGLVTLVKQNDVSANVDEVRLCLKENASETTVFYEEKISNSKKYKTEISKNENELKINKAVIYPFNKEMHSLVRFSDMLPFEIVGICDPIGKRLVGKDSGEVIGIRKNGLKITSDIDKALENCDTLILGDVSELGRIFKKDTFYIYAKKALEAGKNIFSINVIDREKYAELYKLARIRGVKIRTVDIEGIVEKIKQSRLSEQSFLQIPVPILAVVGTGPRVGKFSVQLSLRKWIEKAGYKVSCIGTEPQAALFGFEHVLPITDYNMFKYIHMEDHIFILRKMLETLYQENDPELIIVGGQSGVIPYSKKVIADFNMMTTMNLVMATQPDAFILAVNINDDIKYIKRTISVLEKIFKAKVIQIIVIDKMKEKKDFHGRTIVVERRLNNRELKSKSLDLQKKIGLPVGNVKYVSGQKSLSDNVIAYFTECNNSKRGNDA